MLLTSLKSVWKDYVYKNVSRFKPFNTLFGFTHSQFSKICFSFFFRMRQTSVLLVRQPASMFLGRFSFLNYNSMNAWKNKQREEAVGKSQLVKMSWLGEKSCAGDWNISFLRGTGGEQRVTDTWRKQWVPWWGVWVGLLCNAVTWLCILEFSVPQK